MKKIIFLSFLLFSVSVFSQIDTIHSWERIPGVYYEDTNWWDHYCFNVPCEDTNYDINIIQRIPIGGFKVETARHCYSDTMLKVIGIAASVAIVTSDNTVDTVMSHRPAEYFRLYSADSSGMKFLRETRWDTATVRMRNSVEIWKVYKPYINPDQNEVVYNVVYEEDIFDLYEAYFETPVVLKDTFYVSGTTYANYKIVDTVVVNHPFYGTDIRIFYYDAHPHTTYFASSFAPFLPNVDSLAPRPNIFKKRNLNQDTLLPGGGWTVYPNPKSEPYKYWINIFPIIDTTFSATNHNTDTCRVPINLRISYLYGDTVLLEWDDASEIYELSLSREDSTLTDGEIFQCTAPFAEVIGLDTAVWYIARVRSVCDNNSKSDWSDTIRFFVPGDTTTTTYSEDPQEGIGSVVERFTYLMPNPASMQVAIMSSFRIDRVEIYTLTGQRVVQEKVGGLSSQIDISSLPKGTYLVRIHTNHGLSTKRLVVM